MKLFIYDHCPYCVKVRMIFGLKNINIQLVTLSNDDEKTPISMIGKKNGPCFGKSIRTVYARKHGYYSVH